MSECDTLCLYCEMPLSVRHEHDHFPFPKRHGGDHMLCVCMNCHDLVDRVSLLQLDATSVLGAFSEIPPGFARVFFMRVFRLLLDSQRRILDDTG